MSQSACKRSSLQDGPTTAFKLAALPDTHTQHVGAEQGILGQAKMGAVQGRLLQITEISTKVSLREEFDHFQDDGKSPNSSPSCVFTNLPTIYRPCKTEGLQK